MLCVRQCPGARTLVVTGLPTTVEGLKLPDLEPYEFTIHYCGRDYLTSRGIMLDNIIIPAIIRAINQES
jgi:hypothetical protein